MATKARAYVGESSRIELWRLLAQRANNRNSHAATPLSAEQVAESEAATGSEFIDTQGPYPPSPGQQASRRSGHPLQQGQNRTSNLGPLGLRFVHDETLPCTPPDDDRMSDLLACELRGLSLPVRLLSPDASSRRASRLKRCFCWPHRLPSRSLVGVSRRVRLCSPELCFLQMARSLDLIDLVELGYELCGSYSLSPCESNSHLNRMPLTSRSLLCSCVSRFPKARGARLARQALARICDGSASPAETKLCMLLSLPSRLGGQGLPAPLLNHHVQPEGNNQLLTGKGYFVCDLNWPDARIDVEYDSDRWHSGGIRRTSDAVRRGDLKRLGIDVIEVTASMLFDQTAIDVLGDDLARRLKVRRRTESYDVKGETKGATRPPRRSHAESKRRLDPRRRRFGTTGRLARASVGDKPVAQAIRHARKNRTAKWA